MVIMRNTFSQRGWHMESLDRKETADDEGLGVCRRSRANSVRATFGFGEKSSAAVHTSGLTHGEKNPQSSGDLKKEN